MVEVLTRNLLTPSVSVNQRFGSRKSAGVLGSSAARTVNCRQGKSFIEIEFCIDREIGIGKRDSI